MATEPKKGLNVDDLFEDIPIVIDEKKYTLGKITARMMKACVAAAENTEQDEDSGEILGRQLAVYLRVDESEFVDTDVRKILKVIEFIGEQISVDSSSKNVAGVEASK